MTEFLLDFTATGCARVEAADLGEAVTAFKEILDGYEPDLTVSHEGAAIRVTELSLGTLSHHQRILSLGEVNAEEITQRPELDTMMTPVLCDRWDDGDPDCYQVYDEAEGGGYMGLCPHHADISEPEN